MFSAKGERKQTHIDEKMPVHRAGVFLYWFEKMKMPVIVPPFCYAKSGEKWVADYRGI